MGGEVSLCSCSSARFCGAKNEPGMTTIQAEYDPQGSAFLDENETIALKEAKSEQKAVDRSLEGGCEERSAALAASEHAGQEQIVVKMRLQVLQKLQTAVDSSCADVRELEALLEEARQARIDAPEVGSLERWVCIVRAVDRINQAAIQRHEDDLRRAIDEARQAGVSEMQLTLAHQLLEALQLDPQSKGGGIRKSDRNRLQDAAARLLKEREARMLTQAISGANQACVTRSGGGCEKDPR